MRKARIGVAVVAIGAAVGVSAIGAGVASGSPGGIVPVPHAQPKAVGMSEPNVLSDSWFDVAVAQGSMPLENPTAAISRYGYYADGPLLPALGSNAEATKSEPDKNTYLVFRHGLHGADAHYDYGTHFLFQGHEGGPDAYGSYFTRVNLDADAAHRVTLLGALDHNIFADGSTWNPFARRLLFTGENETSAGGIWQAGADYPSTFTQLTALGYGGFEGIQTDSAGRLWIVSDIGGTTTSTKARQPNSFVYRFVPKNRRDLTKGGKLQALQVIGKNGHPIVQGSSADADVVSQNVADLHTYGNTFRTKWVTVHDSAVDGMATFDANAAAKAAHATPFKRPENGVFRPGSKFRQFFFTETGDTNVFAGSPGGTGPGADAAHGVFGGIFKLSQSSPRANSGRLTVFFNGNVAHMGLDNISFLDKNTVLAVEDAGDTAHTQRAALDSGFAFDVRTRLGHAPTPVRFLAEGRDASATIDSGLQGTAGFINSGDNEITGIHVSDGDPSAHGLLGAKLPHPFHGGWRVFWTQQHGDNYTFEILAGQRSHSH